MRWRNNFSCNIEEIDKQHMRLFEISSKLNILEPICSKIDFQDEIVEVIQELKEYTIYHFSYEEKLMLKYKYPGYNKHQIEHALFIEKVEALEMITKSQSSSKMVGDIIHFVNGWIKEHILKIDVDYIDFFNEKGIY